jgi:hypothetical protein
MQIAAINEKTMRIEAVYSDAKTANTQAAKELHLAGEASDFETFKTKDLVALYNNNLLDGQNAVKKFVNRETAITRVLAIINAKGNSTPPAAATVDKVSKKTASKKKASKKTAKKAGKKKAKAKGKAKAKASGTRQPRIKDEDTITVYADDEKSWMDYKDKTPVRKLPKGPSRRSQCYDLLKDGISVSAYVKKAEKLGVTRGQALACLGKMAEVDQAFQTVAIVRS